MNMVMLDGSQDIGILVQKDQRFGDRQVQYMRLAIRGSEKLVTLARNRELDVELTGW